MDNLGNETENNKFSKIASNFILVLKLQSEALSEPIFSTNIIDQLNHVFNQIQDYNEQIKSDENCDKLLFQKIAQLIPNIEELISQNYLQFTVVSLQAKLNEAYTTLREVMPNSPQANTKLNEIMILIKRAVTRSYSCNFTKLSPSYFTDLRSLFNKLEIDLTSLANLPENKTEVFEQIPQTTIKNITDIINQSTLILDHLNAANSFITKTFSLIKSVKKLQQKNANHGLPIQSHKVLVCPSKPKTESEPSTHEIGQIKENIDKLINEFENDRENQNKIAEYSMKFDRYIKQEFNFNPPTSIFQNILRSITDIIIPEDMENDRFNQLSELFQKLAQLMLSYYQLPEKVSNTTDLSDFIDQTNEYEKTIEGDQLNLDKIFIRSLHDFLIFCRFIKNAGETVEKVNSVLGQNLVSIDLHSLFVLKPSKVISFVEYKKISPSNSESEEDDDKNVAKLNNISRVNAFRSLNVISNDIVSLRERGVDIVPDPMSYEIHPVSILPQIIRLRDYTRQLESQLFEHLCNFDDEGESEGDESYLSTFEGIRKEAENFYDFVSIVPLSCVDLRIKTLLLYQQKFPVRNEESVQFLLNFYSLVYDIYGSFCKLNEIGTVPISSSIQLSYILSMCDDLADHYPCFDKYIEFFNSIDLFNINNDKVLQKFENLKKDLKISLSNWKSIDLITEISKFSKVLTETSEKLESSAYSDNFILGLLKNLICWIQNDNEYRKKSNTKIIQIHADALKKSVSQKVKEDPEFAKLIDVDAVVSVCNLFAKLRERIEDKSKLRSFLAFVECSDNYDKSYENVPIDQIESMDPDFQYDQEETETEAEAEPENQSQNDNENKETESIQIEQKNKIDSIKSDQNQSPQKQATAASTAASTTAVTSSPSSISSSAAAAKKKFNVFTNEKARQIWFDNYSPKFFDNKKQKGGIDSFLPSLIYIHFNNVVTKYCHFLSLGDSFDRLVHEIFSEMLQDQLLKYEITRDELHEYFASNHEQYKLFLKKAKGEINSQFDLTVQHLNELAKTKNRDSHLNEISKKLSSIRSSYKFSNFEWLKELFQCYQDVNSILKENTSFTSLSFNVSSSFQRLNNMIYYCFLMRRCFKVLDSDHIECQPDTSLHLILLDNFSESDHIISESSSMIVQSQIHFIFEGEIGSNPIQLGTSMKILKLFGHIINLPLLLNTLECEFFNFEKFFAKLPPQLTSLQVLINSALFSSANYAKKSLFELTSTRFTIEKYENTMRAFEILKSELKASPFEVDYQQINDAISACSAVSDLNQICLIDDCLSAFCMYPEWDPENRNYVAGSDVFSLRMKMLSMRSKLVKLAKSLPAQYDMTLTTFLHNFSTSFEIPDNFGLYETNDRFFTRFVQLWTSFVSSLKPVDLSDVYDGLRHSARVIISVLCESGHKDVTTLKSLDQLFQTSHHPSLIFKMRLSFLYVQKQLRKYSKVFKENELPFDQVDFYLRILHTHSEFCSLVRQTTSLLNETVSLTAPIHCPTAFSIDHRAQTEDDNEEGQNIDLNGHGLLEGQLSFADQTSLAQMIHITSAANQKCEEKFSNLPILVDEVSDLTAQVNEGQRPIDNLAQIVAHMTELLDIISSQTPNSDEDKGSNNDANSKEKQGQITNSSLLKRDVSILSQHCHSMMRQFEDMVSMNLKVEEENSSLLNEYIVKYDKGLNLVTRSKKSRYTRLFGLLNNSYDIVKNALDTMIVISNDKYTKGEFDSPFNRNLISVKQNRNPINLKLIFLKDKLQNAMKEKGIKLNDAAQEESKQGFVEEFKNKDYNEQIKLFKRLKNQLKNEIDAAKKGSP